MPTRRRLEVLCVATYEEKYDSEMKFYCIEHQTLFTNTCVHLSATVRGYTGWPKKVNHYHESSLNRIKTRH